MTLRPSIRPLALAAAVAVAACSAATPTPTPTPTLTSTLTPSATSTITPTPAPTLAPGASMPPGGNFGGLSFFDEFDGPEIDTARWAVEDGHQDYWPETPWRRNFKKENVYIENGALVIRVAKEAVGFSSGALVSGAKGQAAPFEQAFGRFEARLRFPKQQGHWCAFWLWSESVGSVDGSGRDGTEIDVIEKAWLIDQASHALHWDGYDADHKAADAEVKGMGLDDGGWHTVRLDWYPDRYVFFVDGRETWRTSAGGVSQAPNYILFSEEIGHFATGPEAWGVGPIEDAKLPDYFYVDYIRVYAYEPPR